jgi:hypothetical protein
MVREILSLDISVILPSLSPVCDNVLSEITLRLSFRFLSNVLINWVL